MIEEILLTVICVIGLAPCLLFVIGYWWVTRGKWYVNEVGRFFMSLTTTLGALYALSLISVWIESAWISWVALLIFVAFIIVMWWPLRLLYVAQRERRRGVEQ